MTCRQRADRERGPTTVELLVLQMGQGRWCEMLLCEVGEGCRAPPETTPWAFGARNAAASRASGWGCRLAAPFTEGPRPAQQREWRSSGGETQRRGVAPARQPRHTTHAVHGPAERPGWGGGGGAAPVRGRAGGLLAAGRHGGRAPVAQGRHSGPPPALLSSPPPSPHRQPPLRAPPRPPKVAQPPLGRGGLTVSHPCSRGGARRGPAGPWRGGAAGVRGGGDGGGRAGGRQGGGGRGLGGSSPGVGHPGCHPAGGAWGGLGGPSR